MERVLACSLAMILATTAAEASEFDIDDESWRGLSSLVELSEALGMATPHVPDELHWNELKKTDILLVIYPTRRLEPAHVTGFLRNGGYIVIADDAGESKEVYRRLGFTREATSGNANEFYQGLLEVPIARPWKKSHSLVKGVSKLYTNFPSVFRGADDRAVFAFNKDDAVVVAGERARGKYVAISDSSVFINRMLEFDDNREFVANLLSYMSDSRPSDYRLVIVTGDTDLWGVPTKILRSGSLREQLNRWLDEFNDYLLTKRGVRVFAALLVIAATVIILWLFPLKHSIPREASWTSCDAQQVHDAPSTITALGEAPDKANTVVAMAMIRASVSRAIEQTLQTSAPLMQPTEVIARQLASQCGPAAAQAYQSLAPTLQTIPDVAAAQSHWSRSHFSPQQMLNLHHRAGQFRNLLRQP